MPPHDLSGSDIFFLDVNVPEFSWPKIRTSYNSHADEVYGNPTDVNTAIFTEDADAYFAWCDANSDNPKQISLNIVGLG